MRLRCVQKADATHLLWTADTTGCRDSCQLIRVVALVFGTLQTLSAAIQSALHTRALCCACLRLCTLRPSVVTGYVRKGGYT